MADETRQQPVAIRVTRPYGSADEFLDQELETLTRTSITLLGAQPRPKGVILRFEVVMAGGALLLRGEGRVVGFKENALGDQAGLVLRFTRLDTKSKALVDRAAAIREGRARAALQAAMGEDSLPPAMPSSLHPSSAPGSILPMSMVQMPPAATPELPLEPPPPVAARPPSSGSATFSDRTFTAESSSGGAVPAPPSSDTKLDAPVPARRPPEPPPAAASSAPPLPARPVNGEAFSAAVPESGPHTDPSPRIAAAAPSAARPERRDELLARLRERARALSAERVSALTRR